MLLARSSRFGLSEAEGEGFEPSSDETARNGFRDRRIRPLCHPSAGRDDWGRLAARNCNRDAPAFAAGAGLGPA
jgi:hypothetical protein